MHIIIDTDLTSIISPCRNIKYLATNQSIFDLKILLRSPGCSYVGGKGGAAKYYFIHIGKHTISPTSRRSKRLLVRAGFSGKFSHSGLQNGDNFQKFEMGAKTVWHFRTRVLASGRIWWEWWDSHFGGMVRIEIVQSLKFSECTLLWKSWVLFIHSRNSWLINWYI